MNIYPLSLPNPFLASPVNAFLVVNNNEKVLIDTGFKTSASLSQLETQLHQLDIDLSSLSKILLTHAHLDHFGSANLLQQRTGVPVYLHQQELPKALDPHELFMPEIRSLASFGVPPAMVAECTNEWLSRMQYVEPLASAHTIEHGDRITIGDTWLEVFVTPGHSLGTTCYYLPTKQVLFSGDTVLENITPLPTMQFIDDKQTRFRGLASFKASLTKLRNLKVGTIYPGHGQPFTDLPARIDQILRHHQLRSDLILDLLRTGPLTPFQLAINLFTSLHGLNIYLGLSEVMAHLDLLADTGQIAAEIRLGIPHYDLRAAI